MIYLASPYTSIYLKEMEYRFQVTEKPACDMIKNGEVVFSPIVHWHTAAKVYDLPRGFAFWCDYSLSMLAKADELVVLMLDGWEKSVGVDAEINFALDHDIPVRYKEVL